MNEQMVRDTSEVRRRRKVGRIAEEEQTERNQIFHRSLPEFEQRKMNHYQENSRLL